VKLQILKGIITWVVVILSLGECQIFSAQTTSTSQPKVISSLGNTAKTTKKAVALKQKSSYGQLPIYFEKNQGQTDSHVQFLARGAGYSMFLTPGEAVFLLKEADTAGPKVSGRGRRPVAKTKSPQSNKSAVLRMKLSNANAGSVYEGSDQLPGVVNYLLGKNPANWKKGIPTFASVKVAGIYPGVDMVYHGNQHQMEYDFIVNPGGDPTKIAFKFDGATGVSISSEGHLTMNSPTGTLTVRKPSVYQVENGQQRAVDGKFSRRGADEVGIDLGMYDRTKPGL
jgi:hypothetical protein